MIFDIVILKTFNELCFRYFMSRCELFSSPHDLVASWSQEVSPADERILLIKNRDNFT